MFMLVDVGCWLDDWLMLVLMELRVAVGISVVVSNGQRFGDDNASYGLIETDRRG